MSPFIEQPIPPPTAEQREPIIVPFDPTSERKAYPNALYEFVHHQIRGKRSDVGVRTLLNPDRPSAILALFDRPILGVSTTTPYQITFCAAILEQSAGYNSGWLVSTHEAAICAWEETHEE